MAATGTCIGLTHIPCLQPLAVCRSNEGVYEVGLPADAWRKFARVWGSGPDGLPDTRDQPEVSEVSQPGGHADTPRRTRGTEGRRDHSSVIARQ
jgi:hypothetical protein